MALVAAVAAGCGVGIRGTATQITTSSAVLNGRVVSTAGGLTSYYFEYGRDGQLQQTPEGSIDVAKGFAARVSAPVDGLEPGGPYRFRVCAEDSENPAIRSAARSGTSRSTRRPARTMRSGTS